MIEPLHCKAVEIDEIARDIHADQLPLTFVVIEMPQHGTLDNIVRVFNPLSAPHESLSRLEFDGACDGGFQSALFFLVEIVPQPALQE